MANICHERIVLFSTCKFPNIFALICFQKEGKYSKQLACRLTSPQISPICANLWKTLLRNVLQGQFSRFQPPQKFENKGRGFKENVEEKLHSLASRDICSRVVRLQAATHCRDE